MRSTAHLNALVVSAMTSQRTFATVTEWADERRYIAANASARPGKWRTADVPYMRGIQDACSFDRPAERVVFMKGNQLAGTEGAIMNTIGYVVESWPGPVLVILPKQEDVRKYVQTRFRPAMAATPTVASRLGETAAGAGGSDQNTFVTFPGGQIYFVGSKSPIREMPISVAIIDDADACQTNAEGDIVELAAKRTVTFSQRSKVIVVSTPTIKGASLIDREFENSSQQRFHIPCPLCGAFAPLEWEGLCWQPDVPADVRYRCSTCGREWDEVHKPAAMRAGIWVPGRPEMSGKREGFHVSALYSPFRRWTGIVQDFIAARRAMLDSGDTSKMQVHVNCDLGRCWVLPEQVRMQGVELDVFRRREPPFSAAALPLDVVVVGGDVQSNRIELSAYGVGVGMEEWLLEHVVIKGAIEDAEVWDGLVEFVVRHRARGVCVDASAYQQVVMDQVARLWQVLIQQQPRCALWAVKGQSGKIPVWPRPTRPGELVSIGVDAAKDQIFGALERVTKPGPGYTHFPTTCTEAWFHQLFSERPASVKDRTAARWVKSEGRNRNEALDCKVYARAATYALGAIDPALMRRLIRTDSTGLQRVDFPVGPRATKRPGKTKRKSWIHG